MPTYFDKTKVIKYYRVSLPQFSQTTIMLHLAATFFSYFHGMQVTKGRKNCILKVSPPGIVRE